MMRFDSIIAGPVNLDVSMLFVGPCISFSGVVEGNSNPRIFIPQLVEFYKKGLLPIDRLCEYYPFRELDKALEAAHSGKVIKPVLLF